MSLGERIREEREKRGVSQTRLAAEVGITQAMQSRIEKDDKRPSIGVLRDIACYLNCTIDDLFKDKRQIHDSKNKGEK